MADKLIVNQGAITLLTPYRLSGWFVTSDANMAPDLAVRVDHQEVGSAIVARGDENWVFHYRFGTPLKSWWGQVVEVYDRATRQSVPYQTRRFLRNRVGRRMVGQTRIEGWIDSVNQNTVVGWAVDNENIDHPADIALHLGGKLIDMCPKRYKRDDLIQNGHGSGQHGFEFDLNTLRLNAGIYAVTVSAKGAMLPLAHGRNGTLVIGEPDATPVVKPGVRLAGSSLDRATRAQISGWAIDRQALGEATRVDIGANGVVLKAAVAGMMRADLMKGYPESGGVAGFMYHPPVGFTLSGAAAVSVHHSVSREELRGSPTQAKIGRAGIVLDHHGTRRWRMDMMRRRLQPLKPAGHTQGPKVAAIILNRDGGHFLEALFESIYLHNTYANLELLVVDHGSTDRSRIICGRWGEKLDIRFLARDGNYSYSASNNWGSTQTDADILFLLNNDVIFDSDLIREALPYLEGDVGMLGFKLASPPGQSRLVGGQTRDDFLDVGYELQQVQHLGVRISTSVTDRPFLPYEVPVSRDNASFASHPMEVPGVTAAALLVGRADFEAVGGLHEDYFYGYEDVDFCVTFRALTGKKILCLNHIRAFHHRSASLEQASRQELDRKASNRHILEKRLGRHIAKCLKQERVDNRPFLREGGVRIAFAVSEVSDKTPAGDYFTALELARELAARHGYECVFLPRDDWYNLQDVDVVIAMVDGYRPSQIGAARSDIVAVAWLRNWFERWITFAEMNLFDAIWVSSDLAAEAFRERFNRPVEVVRIATAADRMQAGIETEGLASDICFTGSYFGSPRQISEALDPVSYVPWKLGIFGHGWGAFDHLAEYLRGPKPYSSMPDIYASTKIVIDDANLTTIAWGSVNSRVFDALAAGTLVITNSRTASDDAFDGLLPVYTDRDDLTRQIHNYLSQPRERHALAEKLRRIVTEQHSYAVRADQVATLLASLFSARRITLRFGSPRLRTSTGRALEDLLRRPDLLVHDVTEGQGLMIARRHSAEIAVHVTGSEGFELSANWLRPDCINVVLIACPADTIRPRDLTGYDMAITIDMEAEVLCDRISLKRISLPHLATGGEDGAARAMAIRELLVTALPARLESLLAHADSVMAKTAVVAPAYGPSLQTAPDYGSGSALRLAYVLWDWPALSQTFVLNEIRWLVENGQDVHVYYKMDPDKATVPDFPVQTYRVEDAAELAVLLKAHDRTMIHTHFAYPAAPNLVYPAAVATAIPFTMTPAGVDIFHYDNIKRNRLRELSRSDLCLAVFTLGTFHHRFFIEQGVPPEKIVIERQAVSDLPTPVASDSEGVGQRPQVISFSRFVEKKGYRQLVEAAVLMPETDFILYGYGPQENELRTLVGTLKANNFTFGGPLSSVEEISRACNGATAFALPCVRAANGDMDGLPTVLLEAMMLNVPVVTTRLVNIPDLVTDGVTGFLAISGDVSDFVSKLRDAIAMAPARRAAMIALARDKAAGFASTGRTMHTLMRIWQRKAVDIVLVTYDRGTSRNWIDTRQILERIYRNTTPPFNVIVVDNGSDPSFLYHLEEDFGKYPNFKLIRLGKNHWCGPATNIGFRAGTSDYMIYLCSKEAYVLRRGWERDMVRWMDAHPEIALGGHLVTVPSFTTGAGYTQHPLFGQFRNPEFARENSGRRFDHVQGGIYIYRRSVFERLGGFSDTVPQDSTDIEFSYYLESCGERLGDIPGIRAGTVKTLPGVAAMADEHMIAVHPLSRRTIGRFEKIANGKTKACNICDWHGDAFGAGGACPACGCHPFGRSVMHLLAREGMLQHRPRVLIAADEPALGQYLKRICPSVNQQAPDAGAIAGISRAQMDMVILDGSALETRNVIEDSLIEFVSAGGTLIARGIEGFEQKARNIPDIIVGHIHLVSGAIDADWNRVLYIAPSSAHLVSLELL